MDEFRTIAKIWPVGTEIDLGTDSNILGGPATFTRNAATFVTSPDGTQNYEFLFWNTGRHMTNKRRVRWNFSVLGWGTWTATRWYGTPPTGPGGGPSRVRADSFGIGGDSSLSSDTPIDGAASTYGPGAWPSGGDDHVISTVDAAATVVAKDPFHAYEFAGWLQLMWGGDPTGEFVESDSGTGGTIGGSGFYDHVVGGSFAAGVGVSADLLATYGTHLDSGPGRPGSWRDFLDRFRERSPFLDIPQRGDPSPEDFIRLRIMEQMLRETAPNPAEGVALQQMIEAAPRMSRDELKRAMQSIKTTLGLGQAALAAIDAQMKRQK